MQIIDDLAAGKAGEYLVCADLILKGHIAFPSEQGLPYDVVADIDNRLYKIQVKTTRGFRLVPQRRIHTPAYLFHINRCGNGGTRNYLSGDVDMFAMVALDSKAIGYIPSGNVKRTMIFRAESHRGNYHDEVVINQRKLILQDHALGMRNCDIAIKYDMSQAVVGRIIKSPDVKMPGGRYLHEMTLDMAMKDLM